MAKVLGLGGLFFKARDPDAMKEWYTRVLGIEMASWGAWFPVEGFAAQTGAGTAFSIIKESSDQISPSEREFMFNFVVDDLDGVLERCKQNGVEPIKLQSDDAIGHFAHILDPEGRKIELWQPKG